jgi:Leucine-rich repeat (LRR) protein
MLLFLLIALNVLASAQAVCNGTTTSLSLIGQGLTVLPDLSLCTALTSLDVGGNQLTSLPAEIGRLEKLQTLSLYNNKLTSLPAEIGQLVNLQRFNLLGNQLTTLPAEFGHLVSLQLLTIGDN